MPRRKQIISLKVDKLDSFILELHCILIEEYTKILPQNFFDEICPPRSNTDRIARMHNKLNAAIQKRNYLFLYESCHFDAAIKMAKTQMMELQLKCRRHSMQKTRVDRIKNELSRLDKISSWNGNALSILELQCQKSNTMLMTLLGPRL